MDIQKNDHIKASELGTFLYCHRAWWYERKGKKSNKQKELKMGIDYHKKHAMTLHKAIFLRYLAWGLFLLALIILSFKLLWVAGLP